MKIRLNSQLRKLRLSKGQTQEQLANYLGVTVQAVSKWERGEGYPDIATLPYIAEFFGTSIDTLLGFDEYHKETQLQHYISKADILIQEGSIKECVLLWRNALRELPNDPTVMHNLAFALRREDITKHSTEIIELSTKILENASLSGHYFGAINNLCHAYISEGRIEDAKAIAAKAGRYHGTENQLLLHILDGPDAVGISQANIVSLADLIATNAAMMLHKGSFSTEEQLHIIRQILDIFRVIYDSGDFGFYHCRMSDWHLRAAKLYAKAEDIPNTNIHLKEAREHAQKFDDLHPEKHTSIIVNQLLIDRGVSNTKQMEKIEAALSHPLFDVVRSRL